jgi:hypothetical protein
MNSLVKIVFLTITLVHARSHSSHTSHTSHTSQSSQSSQSSHTIVNNYKSYNIKRIVSSSIISYYIYNTFNDAIKNDFETYQKYKVFNITYLIVNNKEKIQCIYFTKYINNENITYLYSGNNIIYNSSNNLNTNNLLSYCIKLDSKDNNLFYIKIFIIILLLGFCCCFCDCCCCESNINKTNMY